MLGGGESGVSSAPTASAGPDLVRFGIGGHTNRNFHPRRAGTKSTVQLMQPPVLSHDGQVYLTVLRMASSFRSRIIVIGPLFFHAPAPPKFFRKILGNAKSAPCWPM